MDKRFYTEDELRGAKVYDCEGLLYGEAGGLTLLEEGVFIEVYLKRKIGEITVDRDKLFSNLMALGVYPENLTLVELVSLSRGLGLDIPSRTADAEISLLKARVPVEEVLWLDSRNVAPFGELKIIFLATPREAEFRGWRPKPPSKWPRKEDVKGKLVLSISNGIVGAVEEMVIGIGGVGLRVTRSSGGKEVKWLAFVTTLRRKGQDRLADRLTGEIDPYSNPRLTGGEAEKAFKLVKELGAEEDVELLAKHTVESKDTIDVPWSSVVRIGDAVVIE
ncbi:MAG: hypothetical protein QW291_01565 [Thermofilaceae archaeon]